MRKMMVAVAMVMVWMLVQPSVGDMAVTCGSVADAVKPCIGYLRSRSGSGPSAACCSGIRGLNAQASTTVDRRIACSCLKSAVAATNSGIILGLAAGLPAKCGVNIPYSISPNTDCSKIR